MVRLGVIGDTQGRYKVDALLETVARHFADVDQVWHAGDWQEEAVLTGLEALGKPLLVVNGNAPDDPRYPHHVVRELEGVTVGMTHRPPRPDDDWVKRCQVVIHGHTHRWRDEVVGGVRFLNVSTPTAAGFSQERTMGILTLDKGKATLEKILL